MYFGSDHFMSRFIGTDGFCYEYDGMARKNNTELTAECLQLRGRIEDLFPVLIVDSTGTRRKTKGIFYKRR
jgi:hypothetical protein